MKSPFVQYKPEELGSVVLEEVKCGKSNCHCVSGRSHTAYYHYFYTKDKSGEVQRMKKYVPKHEAKKLKQIIQYRRNKLNTPSFVQQISGEFVLYTGENFDNLCQVYKRLHIMLKKAGLVSFSNKRIEELMANISEMYQEKVLREFAS